MDRYEIGFEIAKLIATSNEPLEELKYIGRIVSQLFDMYMEREKIYFQLKKNVTGVNKC